MNHNMKLDMSLSANAVDFIDDEKLQNLIKNTKEDQAELDRIFAKSKEKKALTLEETAMLLAIESKEGLEKLYSTARELKRSIYGNRIVLFAPLYVGNHCINNCKYCGFRASLGNKTVRKTLTNEELVNEIVSLENEGHKRLILVFGEHPKYTPEYIAECVKTCYTTKSGNGEIRRVNINAAPLDIAGFKTVHEAGIGTFQVFQETYHKETYRKFHPAGDIKGDYMWRLNAMDRAFQAGCDDMGIGALFGLYNWKYEVLGLVSHAIHLQTTYGVGPHTISFPRIQPANGLNPDDFQFVTDEQFKHLVAVLRLAVPYTGLIMTARENKSIRDEVMEFGVSQIDAGTKLEIGGYSSHEKDQDISKEQFQVGDTRDLDSVIRWLIERKFIPSFCTSCYRLGRTGEHFMEYAIPGFIGNFCTPNAILTLSEYLEDYASEETKAVGAKFIEEQIAAIQDPARRDSVKIKLARIKEGKRDLLY